MATYKNGNSLLQEMFRRWMFRRSNWLREYYNTGSAEAMRRSEQAELIAATFFLSIRPEEEPKKRVLLDAR